MTAGFEPTIQVIDRRQRDAWPSGSTSKYHIYIYGRKRSTCDHCETTSYRSGVMQSRVMVSKDIGSECGRYGPQGDKTYFLIGHRKITENKGATVTFVWATEISLPEWNISKVKFNQRFLPYTYDSSDGKFVLFCFSHTLSGWVT